MTSRTTFFAWGLISALVALSFGLDHFRMLTSHFNWFMVVQATAVTVVVVAVVRLSRTSAKKNEMPAKVGREET